MKKTLPNTAAKSGKTGIFPKTGAKSLHALGPKTNSSTTSSSSPKSYSSSYSSASYNIPKKGKSTSFGIVWIPTKKRNKHKDMAYNTSHHNERSKDRAPSMYNFMSGDSSNQQPYLEKHEDKSCLLVPEQKDNVTINVLGAGSAIASGVCPDESINPEEKAELIKQNGDETKDAAGDTGDKKDIVKEEMENNEKVVVKPPEYNKEKVEDNVDSVYLRAPPAHKTRSTASTVEEESCGIKCLYYTLQCCDCVLM